MCYSIIKGNGVVSIRPFHQNETPTMERWHYHAKDWAGTGFSSCCELHGSWGLCREHIRTWVHASNASAEISLLTYSCKAQFVPPNTELPRFCFVGFFFLEKKKYPFSRKSQMSQQLFTTGLYLPHLSDKCFTLLNLAKKEEWKQVGGRARPHRGMTLPSRPAPFGIFISKSVLVHQVVRER